MTHIAKKQRYLLLQQFNLFRIILFVLFISILPEIKCTNLRAHTMVNNRHEQVYNVTINNQVYYLSIRCRQKNMLSVSLTSSYQFEEHPRFNIYGNTKDIPKMGKKQELSTNLQQCPIVINVEGEHMLELKRNKNDKPFFAIADASFSQLHNSFKIVDESVKWGLGQRFQSTFRITDGKWTLWNRDKAAAIDKGLPNTSDQTYGFQPVYLARNRQTKKHHLIYFKNTFGLLVDVTNDGDYLEYHSVGGPMHFLIITGDQNPEPVIEQYHDYIGPSLVPPFWAMGYHQCRWGYESAEKLVEVVSKLDELMIPIDTIWSDLEYMDKKMIFTVNPKTHGGKLNTMMKEHEIHFIPLLDVGVSIYDERAMSLGKNMDVFLRDPYNPDEYYEGVVWPGQVHFVDFLHSNGSQFWKIQMKRLYEQVQFSGIWLDMNEPSNFRSQEPKKEPFKIQKSISINDGTLNVDVSHYSKLSDKLYQREVHTYFGHLTVVAINEFLRQSGKRPFIISRSNSVGTGYFAGHWTGDNDATWDFLRLSISGNFLFQIFGIQMVGPDICGFKGDTTQQLCARWYQLGAFYPFCRNHNHDGYLDQEPYSFGHLLRDTSRQSLRTRYALLKYMYSIMVEKKGRGGFFRPLNFQFPLDQAVYKQENIQTQFLIGHALMVAPVVYQGHIQRTVYFPGERQEWYSFQLDNQFGKVRSSLVKKYSGKSSSTITNQMYSAAPTFLRGGYALMINKPMFRVKYLSNRFNIFAALKNGEAVTKIMAINDYDNETQLSKCISEGCFMEIKLRKTESDRFALSWSYRGNQQLFGFLSIEHIVVVEGDEKWIFQGHINIENKTGSTSLQIISS